MRVKLFIVFCFFMLFSCTFDNLCISNANASSDDYLMNHSVDSYDFEFNGEDCGGWFEDSIQVGKTKKLNITMNESTYEDIIRDVPGFTYDVFWYTDDDDDLVDITEDGYVTGTHVGTAIIKAEVQLGDDPENIIELEISIKVKPKSVSYSSLKNYLKSKKKGRSYIFKEVKKGKKCYLQGSGYTSGELDFWKKSRCYEQFYIWPKIIVEKKGKKVKTRMVFDFYGFIVGPNYDDSSYDTMLLKKGKNKIEFFAELNSRIKYKPKDRIWTNIMSGYFDISDTKYINRSDVKKLRKICKGKYRVKFYERDGASVAVDMGKMPSTKKMIGYYEKCLDKYGISLDAY